MVQLQFDETVSEGSLKRLLPGLCFAALEGTAAGLMSPPRIGGVCCTLSAS